MIDIYGFLSSLKISWLKRTLTQASMSEHVTLFYPQIMKMYKLGSEFIHNLTRSITNMFWCDVFKHYRKLCEKCHVEDIDDFNAEFIFYNKNVTVGHHTVYYPQWVRENIYQICHVLDEDGQYLSYGNFCLKYPNVNIHFLNYRSIIDAIKEYQNKVHVDLSVHYKKRDSKPWNVVCKGNKTVYCTLTNSNTIPAGVRKWNNLFQNLNWKSIFDKCFATTSDNQLRWFQYRILHRLLPTARYLFLRNIVDSPTCSFCENEEETIQHLLWHCDTVATFWNDLQQLIANTCTHLVNFSLHEDLVIFGVRDNFFTNPVLDFIILMGKFFIYKCKFTNNTPTIPGFQAYLKNRYKLEKILSSRKNQYLSFIDNWLPYMGLVPD